MGSDRNLDAELIAGSSFFDTQWYLRTYPDLAAAGVDPVLHYLTTGGAEGRDPSPSFSTRAYWERRPDVRAAGVNSLVHYLRHGIAEMLSAPPSLERSAMGSDRNLDAELIAGSSFFDAQWYLRTYPDLAAAGVDPVLHYLTTGGAEGRDPSPSFSTRAYWERRPDVRAAGVNSLVHYLRHGIAEMQSAPPSLDSVVSPPPEEHQSPHKVTLADLIGYGIVRARIGSSLVLGPARRKIFFVTHDATRTGAPLILKTLISHFARSKSYDLFTFIAAPGELIEEFQRHSHIVDCAKHDFFGQSFSFNDLAVALGGNVILAICNTANVNHFATAFRALDIPVMTLVHEMAFAYDKDYFASIYTTSNKVIFPAEFVRAVADEKAPLPEGKAAVVPQGLLDPDVAAGSRSDARRDVRRELGIPDDSFIVLGCGTLDARKGSDLFVSLAERVSSRVEDMHFVWLGSDTTAASFAYWMKKDVRVAGLADTVHLIGARSDPSRYYLAADLFVLTSREDPFPCVVHEAMACGLVVIAFQGSGGAAEALQDGTGVIVPYRDLERMADAVLELHGDAGKREQIGQRARRRVETVYSFRDYYIALAQIAHDDLNVPVDREDFAKRDLSRPLVFFFNRDWWISGVNSFAETLVRGVVANGIDAQMIFPEISENDRAHVPAIPHRFLQLEGLSLEAQWKELIDFAERNAPCVLVPNYDYLTSAISPALSSKVGVLGIIHSDDVEHYDHVYRLGRYWNRIVCLTPYMAGKVGDINPAFESKITVVPYGIPIPNLLPERPLRSASDPITMVYSGRVVQHQKRVRDFVALTRELDRRKVSYKLTIIGEGDDLPFLKSAWEDQIADGRVVVTGRLSRQQTLDEVARNDVFVLVSDFEGMPLSLLEAMSRGTVPIVSHTPCGIPELVLHDVTGFLVPVGDVAGFATYIEILQKDPLLLRRLSFNAHQRVLKNGFRDVDMAERYSKVVRDIWKELISSSYRRPEPIVWRSPVPNISIPNFVWKLK
jgi:glycosyltransferase involved in cell wall biosynthesis